MLKKKFLKTKCKVTFFVPTDVAANIESVHLVGDFNDWDEAQTLMELDGRGKAYKVQIDLKLNQQYQFRYLVNGTEWHNDWEADGYHSNDFGGDNSLVDTTPPQE